jgi:hypothetical protein
MYKNRAELKRIKCTKWLLSVDFLREIPLCRSIAFHGYIPGNRCRETTQITTSNILIVHLRGSK